jgi:hypothetical protein
MARLDRNQVEQHELEFVAGEQPAASATPAAERPAMAAATARPAMTPATKSTTAAGSTPATLHERKITMIAMVSEEMHIYS